MSIQVIKGGNFDYLTVSKLLTIPHITTPVGPAGSIGYQDFDQGIYYSNGDVWLRIDDTSLFE